MSRALDKDITASLRTGDPAIAYREISQALAEPLNPGLLEIELLGRSHPVEPATSLLRDGNAIAIPKIALVQAFLIAREILTGYRENAPGVSQEDALAATAVILLMDPEHLTAANTRKRLIQMAAGLGGPLVVLIEKERRYIDSLLTSHLHRHTKSPTLWSHRRWLLNQARSSDLDLDVLGDITKVIMVSAERHPRNYYAWCHARWLMEALSDPGHTKQRDVEEEQGRVISATKDWAFKHHTDTSGWSFLYFLLVISSSPSRAVCSSTFTEVAKLAAALRWTNESVWGFLRTLASSKFLGQKEYEAFLAKNHLLKSMLPGDSSELKPLQRAEEWCEMYREGN